jgi:hypothetical protein
MADIDISKKLCEQIATHVGGIEDGEVLPSFVRRVLTAWQEIRNGDPVGTTRRNPDTGAIAHRVNDNGLHLWRISAPDGTQYNDTQPTLDWPKLGAPPA